MCVRSRLSAPPILVFFYERTGSRLCACVVHRFIDKVYSTSATCSLIPCAAIVTNVTMDLFSHFVFVTTAFALLAFPAGLLDNHAGGLVNAAGLEEDSLLDPPLVGVLTLDEAERLREAGWVLEDARGSYLLALTVLLPQFVTVRSPATVRFAAYTFCRLLNSRAEDPDTALSEGLMSESCLNLLDIDAQMTGLLTSGVAEVRE